MRKGTINMYLFHSLDHKEANQQILIKVLVSDFLKKKVEKYSLTDRWSEIKIDKSCL